MRTLDRGTEYRSIQAATETTTTICELFAAHLAIEVPAIEADLIESGLLDSLAVVDLLMQLERSFGFTVVMDDLDIEDFRTVERIAAYVARCRG
jgi:acyl carrier protein